MWLLYFSVMLDQAMRIAQKLEEAQGQVSQFTRQLIIMMSVKEGDRIRVQFEFGGQVLDQVGVVRVVTTSSFFLELEGGALLMVEDVISMEILASSN